MDEDSDSIVPQPDDGGTTASANDQSGSDTDDSESESLSTTQASGGGGVVNYYFPVELVVSGKLMPEQIKEIREQILQEFTDSINRRLP